MKKISKAVCIIAMLALIVAVSIGFVACNDPTTLTVAAPEGTPALAIARLAADNKKLGGYNMKYEVLNAQNIGTMMSAGTADVVIIPINTGALKALNEKKFKLVSVAVNGSLFMVGKSDEAKALTASDLYGKRIACIGKENVPGVVFRYVMSNMGVSLVNETTTPDAGLHQASVRYISDGTVAMGLLQNNQIDYAVVGEPAATTLKSKLGLKAEMDMQAEYTRFSGEEEYPQAGLFVKNALAENQNFMTALFDALAASKQWVMSNPGEVSAFAKQYLYQSANFPAPSIARCAIDCERLSEADKNEIIAFLTHIAPTDSNGSAIDWSGAKAIIF